NKYYIFDLSPEKSFVQYARPLCPRQSVGWAIRPRVSSWRVQRRISRFSSADHRRARS
ncbi:hypothetical protein KZ870_07935, partial [Pseudomonas aeruginosa]|nr:hypothetical protein [Pseudomonas aeruginosa]